MQLVSSFPTITDMRSADGSFAVGDVAEVSGYTTPGDGGGGAFYFEGTPPGSATITNIASLAAPINGATNATPIEVSTVSPHGLSTGNAVLISNVTGNRAANGAWLVSVADSTHFTLKDSKGSGQFTTGAGDRAMATTALVTTKSAHGLLSGSLVMIAGVAGATGANGRWFPVGYVSDISFTIPCGDLPAYTRGGVLGDAGVSVPSMAGTSRWIRRAEGSRYDARWFGAVGDGMTDDTAALSGAIKAAHSVHRTATLPAGATYRVSRELDMSTPGEVGLEGESTHGRGTTGTLIVATNAGMRSVIAMGDGYSGLKLKGLRIIADQKATYGVFMKSATSAQLEGVNVVRAVKDGFFLSARRDDGTTANNNNIVVKNCSAKDCGTLYQTANLKDHNSYPGPRTPELPAPGTATIKQEGTHVKVVGVDTKFLSLGARQGDFIRLGGPDPGDPVSVFEIETVDSDTSITLSSTTIYALTTKHENDDYAVGVGDGWHEQLLNDNSRAYIEGGIWYGNAGCAFRHMAAYGPVVLHPDIYLTGMYGIAIGSGQKSTGVQTSVLIGPLFDGDGAAHGCVRAEAAHGLSIINPLWSGADNTLTLGFAAQNVHTFHDTSGVSHYGGTHRYTDIAWHEHTKRGDHPASGMTTGFVSAQATEPPGSAYGWQFLIPRAKHTGKIRVDVRGTYETSSGVFTGGSKVIEVSYHWDGTTLTMGTLDDVTPPHQIDPTLPNPTFRVDPIDNPKYLQVRLGPTSTPFGSHRTFWAGEARVTTAGTVIRPAIP